MTLIDARGMRCPWPAIRVAKAIRDGAPLPIEVLADDPAAPRELAAVAKASDFRLETIAPTQFRLVLDDDVNALFTGRD